ncbi:MAG: transglycosylase SLT domain-containing protein, partial [Bryobacteraceae bacterium]|nr:transglycosylase SLT domain-containing protein [Bryobacteraceae bacterium]
MSTLRTLAASKYVERLMRLVFAASLAPVLFAQLGWLSNRDHFVPANTLSGVGAGRTEISDAVLKRRTELMIESQTFGILRDPRSLAGAQRITSPKLKKIFDDASRRSGLPSSFIAAIAFLESFGVATAESPAGPKGIMQIAAGTARMMNLPI